MSLLISFHLLTGPLAHNLSLLSAKSNFDNSKRSSIILKIDIGTVVFVCCIVTAVETRFTATVVFV